MKTRSALVATLLTILHTTIQQCLSKDELAFLNVTATASLVQDANATICKNIYSEKGYCATIDSVRAAIDQFKENMTKAQLQKMEKIANMISNIGPRFQNMAQNVIDFKKGKLLGQPGNGGNQTQGQAPQNQQGQPQQGQPQQGQPAQGQTQPSQPPQQNQQGQPQQGQPQQGQPQQGQNGQPQQGQPQQGQPQQGQNGQPQQNQQGQPQQGQNNQGNKQGPPPRNMTTMNLNDNVLNQFDALKKKMQNPQDFMRPMTNQGRRQDCAQAQFRLLIGTMCAITSGDGKKYIQFDANGQISAVYISNDSAADVFKHCIDSLVQACDLADMQATVVTAVNDATNTTALPPKPEFCGDVTALQNCANNTATCSDSLKKAVLEKGFAPFAYKMTDNVNPDLVDLNAQTLDSSLNATVTTAAIVANRRLVTSNTQVSFIVSASGANIETAAAASNISDAPVTTVAVPTILNNASVLLALLSTIVLGLY